MKKYLHEFQTQQEFEEAYNGDGYYEPWVSLVVENSSVSFNKPPMPHDYSKDYLTFEITSDGVIRWKAQNTAYTTTIQYSKDNGETWTSITSNTESYAPTISVISGDTVQFRGNNTTYSSGSSYYNSFSGTTCGFNVKGNIMSLINSTGFATATTLASSYTFLHLFYKCVGLIDASNLVLPATTLTDVCYYEMFWGCTGLTAAPSLLPATTLTSSCYNGMFFNCTSLTTTPELPATTLAERCYLQMFRGCTSLTTAPVLPAETLNFYCCYQGMFSGCTSLNYIKCLATTISGNRCTEDWLRGVAATGTFVKNANMSSWTTGVDGIPANWTVEDATV